MSKPALLFSTTLLALASVCASTPSPESVKVAPKSAVRSTNFKPFTGKILGSHVRLRSHADVDSAIVTELEKNSLVVVVGEDNDFYAIEPLALTKAYIFRSFVLDGQVEGNRVNVRLAPNLESPIITHLSTGEKIEGRVCEENNKWLEIAPPASTRFYVAKEYMDYVGGPELKGIYDKKLENVKRLTESTNLLVQSEMEKPFVEIDYERIAKGYHAIIEDYSDFTTYVDEAKAKLTAVHESYLQKKLTYLENKASNMETKPAMMATKVEQAEAKIVQPNDRMKIWEPVERALYLSWSACHNEKTMKDFYSDQQNNSKVLTGILEAYTDPVKMKPGDFVLREKGMTVAYLYSTHLDLGKLVGKEINVIASKRPNNNFAFDAFYVLDVE